MSIKCANCEMPAVYTLADPGANPLDYCATDLPSHMLIRAVQGNLPLRSETLEVQVPPQEIPTVQPLTIEEHNIVEEEITIPKAKKITKAV